MQIFSKPEPIVISYPLRNLGDQDGLLFFDIETTGLAPSDAQIFLIGALNHTSSLGWQLTQWFAEDLSSEQEILRTFFDYAKGFSRLIHYNGSGFDLPFIKKCADQYHLDNPLTDMDSTDLYKLIRPYRKIFPTEHLNQKTMEHFLGLDRADHYTGAELISVYESYLSTSDLMRQQLLLLHNEEDVTGLTYLLSLLAYPDFLGGLFYNPIAVDRGDRIVLDFESAAFLPHEISLNLSPLAMTAKENILELTVSAYNGTAFHYFDDYENYYYLPLEDKAVHKSVGEFVDKSARVKATRETARVAKTGMFLPVFGPVLRPVFYTEYKGAMRYVQKDDYDFADKNSLTEYAYAALHYLGLRQSKT